MTVDGKTALVTGASRGLGKAIALGFAKEGWAVALTARTADALEAVAEEALAAGAPAALAIPSDLSRPDAPADVVAQTVQRFGRLDALVNNAGDTKRGDFHVLTDADHLSGFEVKYHGAVRFCRAAWPHLEAAKGSIVNIAGIGAQTPVAEFTIGGPVNSAMINLTKALSKTAKNGAPRVNVVCPGLIVTDRLATRIRKVAEEEGVGFDDAREILRQRLGLDRFGDPEDIASMVHYLCSDRGAYVNGATLVVDGGATPGV